MVFNARFICARSSSGCLVCVCVFMWVDADIGHMQCLSEKLPQSMCLNNTTQISRSVGPGFEPWMTGQMPCYSTDWAARTGFDEILF